MSESILVCVAPLLYDRKWMMMFVRVFVWTCERACHRSFQAEVCFSSPPQPHVWWIPVLTAADHHDLLPRSGAGRFQHQPYINLAGEKCWGEKKFELLWGQTFQSDGRAKTNTALIPDDNVHSVWNYQISMHLFLRTVLPCDFTASKNVF